MTILEGKKVLLRPVKMEDLPLFLKWFNDPKITQWLIWRDETPLTKEFEMKWIEGLPSKTDWQVFVIGRKAGAAAIPIGICGIDDIDSKNRCAGIGVTIGEREFWNQGLGTETYRLLIEYAFKKLNLQRLESRVLAYNNKAIRVLTKLGFKEEGYCRKCVFKKGKFESAMIFGLLRHEWKSR